jgi:hypothetical protein
MDTVCYGYLASSMSDGMWRAFIKSGERLCYLELNPLLFLSMFVSGEQLSNLDIGGNFASHFSFDFRMRLPAVFIFSSHRCLWNKNFVLMFVDPCIVVQFIKKNLTRCNSVSKFYYFVFIWSSASFERHTAHYQEPKTALAASGFHTWKIVGRVVGGRGQAQYVPDHVQCRFSLLMMGGVSPETCWASYKYRIIKLWYIVASCWVFLCEEFCQILLRRNHFDSHVNLTFWVLT